MSCRITKPMIEALKRYYKNQGTEGWDKQADLKNFGESCPKKGQANPYVTYSEASAGTFLVWWSDGVQTLHKKHQYWQGTVFTRTVDGKCWQEADIWTGKKLPKRKFLKEVS